MIESTAVLKQEIDNLDSRYSRVERIVEKQEDNITRLTTLCAEVKSLTESNARRMDHMEDDHQSSKRQIDIDKTEFNRTVARIHDKIESSEAKSEDKIDSAVKELSQKIDGLCDKSGHRIDKLAEEVKGLTKKVWLAVGGFVVIVWLISTKFEILKLLVALTGAAS